jgi:transposase
MEKQIAGQQFFSRITKFLDERTTRLVASAAALSMGRGGITEAARLADLSRPSIYAGINELKAANGGDQLPTGRQRRPGAGRKKNDDIELRKKLESLIEPYEHGNPESPLRWTSKSLRNLSDELEAMGHRVSHVTVGRLLGKLGYTLQSNKKSHEGGNTTDRNAQFEQINHTAKEFIDEGQPVISVDAKKKELVGNFKNNGVEYRPSGNPEEVNVYDFIDPTLGRATPYGIYDVSANEGYVGVCTSHDTARFAVETIEKWWLAMGQERYPEAHSLFITADGGGSNGSRNRLWKKELQSFADRSGINVFVSHFPPGTSKWNKIEHRMFSAISMNWRGKPLVTTEVIVNLIASTTTRTGLRIKAEINTSQYETGEKVSDDELAELRIIRHEFHPEWNYAFLCHKL